MVEDTTIRDDKCRRRANPQIDRPARPPRYVALIGTFRCTIGILSRQWWNCSEHFQTSHNSGGNLGDPTISKPACAWNTCATCAHLRDTLHLMESYYGFNQSIQLPTFALKEELSMKRKKYHVSLYLFLIVTPSGFWLSPIQRSHWLHGKHWSNDSSQLR